jgi:hypothetical protein
MEIGVVVYTGVSIKIFLVVFYWRRNEMRNLIKTFLARIASLHPFNHIDGRQEYPQTWYLMPKRNRWPRLVKFLQFLCVIFTGHELSKTEWGYGGGKYADRWCRWCNKMISVPLESTYFQFPMAKEMTKCLKSQKRVCELK